MNPPHGSHPLGLILAMPDLSCPPADMAQTLRLEGMARGIYHRVFVTAKPAILFGWKNIAVGDMSRDAAIAIARKHCANCDDVEIHGALEPEQLVKPEPFTRWAPVRGGTAEKSWEGAHERKPWDYACELSIPCLDAGDTIGEIVQLWQLQTMVPYIVLIDTGSTPDELAKLEALRGPGVEVHSIRSNAYHHPSDPVAISCDMAFSMCRSEISVMTHSDVFPRRRDVIEELLGLCSAECPAVGYQMTERMFPGWEKVVSHTLSAFHMPTMWRIGGGWSLARLCSRRGIGHYPNSALASMPDTEVLLSDILEENGIKPLFIGKEVNYEQTLDDRIRHVRSLAGSRLYAPAHEAKTRSWLQDGLEEARQLSTAWLAESHILRVEWPQPTGEIRIPVPPNGVFVAGEQAMQRYGYHLADHDASLTRPTVSTEFDALTAPEQL